MYLCLLACRARVMSRAIHERSDKGVHFPDNHCQVEGPLALLLLAMPPILQLAGMKEIDLALVVIHKMLQERGGDAFAVPYEGIYVVGANHS
jgi:hypothetical protein